VPHNNNNNNSNNNNNNNNNNIIFQGSISGPLSTGYQGVYPWGWGEQQGHEADCSPSSKVDVMKYEAMSPLTAIKRQYLYLN
jgi:hypothetical protein